MLGVAIDEIRAAVVDVGTSTLRLGSAGNDMPRCIFRSVSVLNVLMNFYTTATQYSCNTLLYGIKQELGVIENSDKTSRFVYGNNGYRHLDNQLNLLPLSSSSGCRPYAFNKPFIYIHKQGIHSFIHASILNT